MFFQISYTQKQPLDTLNILNDFLIKEVNRSYINSLKYKIIDGTLFRYKEYDKLNDSISFENFVIKRSNLYLKNYALFEVNIKKEIVHSDGFVYRFKANYYSEEWLRTNILIGFSSEGILVLSGNLPNSIFSHMFNLKNNNLKEYIDYLSLKLFSSNFSDIKYVKKNSKWIYFSCIKNIFSKKTKIYFRVKRDFPDFVDELGPNISGKYR